jgi:cytochrome c oxidase assembly factor CtaG
MMLTGPLWNWGSPVWLVVAALLIAYLLAFGSRSLPRLGVLAIGLGLWVLAYVSPVGVLADGYLFSAHMVQHLLLLLVIPLCLTLSLPPLPAELQSEPDAMERVARWMAVPVVAWVLGVGAMWFWHVPSLCNASTQNGTLGLIRDASFIAAGLAFWSPIYSRFPQHRMRPLDGIAYLFSACLGCTLLGIYLTFTTLSVCPAFASPVDRISILNRLYDAGLTPGIDQHIGGLLMWVPPCTLYVCVIVSLLCRWYTGVESIHPVQPVQPVATEENQVPAR